MARFPGITIRLADPPRQLAPAAGTVLLLLAGCGAQSTAPGTAHRPPPATKRAIGAPPANGAAVFARSCSGCHSLIGNESRQLSGGDLLGFRLARPLLAQYVAEMPVPQALTPVEMEAVVDYVLAVQHARGR